MEESQKTLRIHPDGAQLICIEQPSIVLMIAIILVAGLDDLFPQSLFWPLVFLAFADFAYLAFRYTYLTGMVFVIGDEQIMHEHGVFTTQRDYIELYRVVDYSEHRSFIQILLGLKTVNIYSGDRTNPRLDIIGVRKDIDVIGNLRTKVEYNKSVRNIHEFTNLQ